MIPLFKGIVSSMVQLIEALVEFDYEEALKEEAKETEQGDSAFYNEEHPYIND
ncbi:hypothetical protein GMD78_00695 [Ornithinibacillus sp. L9]|uniref:Uncharacterized protein n=1 Tax=Ornithinibacillus caprae TaxID=2678566 RepID=A0A6N8FBJ7_9BACI|nr:hypothetical protein [Ornithinibacillus caprae]MUK86920.1 hypothetical protein [Ornithinibacillus caprae]